MLKMIVMTWDENTKKIGESHLHLNGDDDAVQSLRNDFSAFHIVTEMIKTVKEQPDLIDEFDPEYDGEAREFLSAALS